MSPDAKALLYRRASIEGNALGEEIVFFDDRVGKYYATGRVGADIWKMLESPMTLDAIVAGLLAQYEVDEMTCRKDTVAFLEGLLGAKILSAD